MEQSVRPKKQRIKPEMIQAFDHIAAQKGLPTKIYNSTVGGLLGSFPRVSLTHRRPLLVVGYYTPDANYRQLAHRMQGSVLAQGLSCNIYQRPSMAGPDMRPMVPWVLNCSQKGQFLWEVRQEYPNTDLLYLDADAVMVRRPTLFLDKERNYDFAAPFLTNKYVSNELVSNTMFFAANKRTNALLQAWMNLQQKRNKKLLAGGYPPPFRPAWDQKTLQDVLPTIPNLRYMELPWTYAKIGVTYKGEELMRGLDPDEIVIMQYQASRQNRHSVGTAKEVQYDYSLEK